MRLGELTEARSNPDKNIKYNSGVEELQAKIHKLGRKVHPWLSGVSMTRIPKLGINPKTNVTEESPMGIYFYPLWYFNEMVANNRELPWGDNYLYLQFFTYSAPGDQTLVNPNRLDFKEVKQNLLKYVPEEVIQEVLDEKSYSDNYYLIYMCLQKHWLQTNEWNEIKAITLWNKILRDMGVLVLSDSGDSWIAPNEPVQGCILDPRVIREHITVRNYKRKKPNEIK